MRRRKTDDEEGCILLSPPAKGTLLGPPAKGTLAPITLGSATYRLGSSQVLFKLFETGGIFPTHFELYPTTIPPGGVVETANRGFGFMFSSFNIKIQL